MRVFGKWLTYVIAGVAATLILFNLLFFDTTALTSTIKDIIKLKPEEKQFPASLQHGDINELWWHWSGVILDAKPAIPALELRYSSPNILVQTRDNSTRQPYTDLIVDKEQVVEGLKGGHDRFIRELARLEQLSTLFKGYGVAMVGGDEFFGPAITSIQMLRRAGCHLPVEVFVPDEKEYEQFVCEEFLPKLNAKCILMTSFLNTAEAPKLSIRRYQLKSLALLLTSFKHVLFLDSDSFPLMDPYLHLMKVEPYLSRGLVIWPDFWLSTESPSFWQIAGMKDFPQGLPVTSSETGQFLINKGTHLKAVLLAAYYNAWGPDYYYPLLSQGALGQGDKETFLAAAVVLDLPWYRVREHVQPIKNDDGLYSKGNAMLQHHAGDDYANFQQFGDSYTTEESRPPRPFFIHANTPKMNAGHLMDEGDIVSKGDSSKHLRLLGSEEVQKSKFGFDVEARLWELMESTGCQLADKLNDWKHRERLCERIREHVAAILIGQGGGSTGDGPGSGAEAKDGGGLESKHAIEAAEEQKKAEEASREDHRAGRA